MRPSATPRNNTNVATNSCEIMMRINLSKKVHAFLYLISILVLAIQLLPGYGLKTMPRSWKWINYLSCRRLEKKTAFSSFTATFTKSFFTRATSKSKFTRTPAEQPSQRDKLVCCVWTLERPLCTRSVDVWRWRCRGGSKENSIMIRDLLVSFVWCRAITTGEYVCRFFLLKHLLEWGFRTVLNCFSLAFEVLPIYFLSIYYLW